MNDLRKASRLLWVFAAVVSLVVPVAGAECGGEQQANLAAELKLRLKPYLQLREEAKSRVPALKETDDNAALRRRQEALANSIRAARGDARQGDILGGPVGECMVPLIQRSLARRTAKQTTKEGNPAEEGPGVKVAVNALYLPGAPLSTMPPTLLTQLPKLPSGLEYRFVGRTLILYDVDACLIVDFIRNAGV